MIRISIWTGESPGSEGVMPDSVARRAGALVLAGFACALASCATGIAAAAEDARFIELQGQMARVQAQLRQLGEENGALRERLARIERSLAQLTGALAPPSASVSAGVPAPRVADSSALPTPPTPSMPSTAGAAPLTGGGRLWGYGGMYYLDPTGDANHAPGVLGRGGVRLGVSLSGR